MPLATAAPKFPEMSPNAPPPSRDSVYRMIQWVMLSDVLIGMVLIAVGAFVMDEPAFAVVGVGLAIIGFVLFFVFRALARKASAPSRNGPHDLRR